MQDSEIAAGADQAQDASASPLPRLIALRDGAAITLRLMTAADLSALAAFLGSVPSDDLLALRRVAVAPAAIERWATAVGAGRVITVLAETGGHVCGEANLRLNDDPATAHTAEIEVIVAPQLRARGLGAALVTEVFLLALGRGVRKVVAPMTLDAGPALTLFRALGFQIEGLLRGQLRDGAGEPHDLVLMGLDVDEFYRRMTAYGVDEIGGE